MSTPIKARKELRELTETPSVLGTAVRAALHGFREEDVLELIVVYSNCGETAVQLELTERLLRALGEIDIQGEETDEQNERIQRASQELRQSHRKFRAALMWLCSSKPADPGVLPSLKRLESGQVEWGRYPLIDKKSEGFVRYFESHGLRHFRTRLSLQKGRLVSLPRIMHLVDVFCACILDSCLGRKPSEMPIKICPRCRKLFLSERREFCSKDCQWKHYWTPERRADDKWIKGLEKFSQGCEAKYGRSVADLRKKLSSPKVADRLKSIKRKIEMEDWAGWRKIAKRIDGIEKLATDSNKD